MTFHRRITVALIAVLGLMAFAVPGSGTPLAPFIDLQEAGLTLVEDGVGLVNWGGTPVDLEVNVGGNVRFALLYWAGRERPCTLDASGTTCPFSEPFLDQQVVFEGVPLTGTVIGTETQPISGGGPILNVGYFADVTSIVAAAGPGNQSFTFADGNPASNFWRFDGVGLMVGYTDASNPNVYRVVIHDGMDFAFGPDPTPGDTRVTAPVHLNHGANPTARSAELYLFVGDGEIDRPDNATVSNNPTIFNLLDNSDGPQWNTDMFTINIPAGAGTTTVQLNSEPVNQNPDSLLWVLAAIRVEQLDTSKPTCPTVLLSGPPAQAVTTFQDTGSGLAELLVTKSENADTVVPPFTVGTTDPVVVTSTKIDQTKRARIEIRATDLAGNVAICDPIHLILSRDGNKPIEEINPDVPRAEDKVTIRNGTPGLAKIDILVNGVKFQVKHLKDGEETMIDISSAMHDGDDNSVNFFARGKKGAWAEIIIWDGGAGGL